MLLHPLECAAVDRSIDCGIAASLCFGRGGGLLFGERSPRNSYLCPIKANYAR